MKLDGKPVLVTGGSSGIGFEIAKALLAKGPRSQSRAAVRALSLPPWRNCARPEGRSPPWSFRRPAEPSGFGPPT